MPKLYVCLILIAMLFVASCDRFKHAFEPETTIDYEAVLFTPLQTAFTEIDSGNVEPVMSFYADSYLHNGMSKSDMEEFYLNLFSDSGELTFQSELLSSESISDTLASCNWKLTVSNSAKAVLVDSTFTGAQLVKRENVWKLNGNQVGNHNVTLKQRVIIETFTYTTCPNCPVVEALLHQLQLAHPDEVSYMEYHINDQLDLTNGNYDTYGYYNYPSMPSVVFNGNHTIIGNNPDNEATFNALEQQISSTDSAVNFSDLNYTINSDTRNLTGDVRLNVVSALMDTTHMKLKYAIIDKQSVLTNSAGDPCRNVVIAKGEKAISVSELADPVSFHLLYGVDLPAIYEGVLPSDAFLVMWVQTTPDPFANNAVIYNGIEVPLTISKK